MIRPFIGLAVTCLLVGCGTSETPTANNTAPSGDLSTEVATDTTDTKVAEAPTSTRTVAYLVPGMT